MKLSIMNDEVRKFEDLEKAWITWGQWPDSELLIGDGFYAIGRKSDVYGMSVLRVSGFMVAGGVK